MSRRRTRSLAVVAVAVLAAAAVVAVAAFVLSGGGSPPPAGLADRVLDQREYVTTIDRALDDLNVLRGAGVGIGGAIGLVVGAVAAYSSRGES